MIDGRNSSCGFRSNLKIIACKLVAACDGFILMICYRHFPLNRQRAEISIFKRVLGS